MKKLIIKALSIFKLNQPIEDFKNIIYTPIMRYGEMDYDKYWIERTGDNYFQPRFSLMTQQIKPNSSILDIGCGDGAFLNYLKKNIDNITEQGIDISKTGVQKAIEKGINAKVKPIEDFKHSSDLFDYVSISEVIEHVPNSEFFVKLAYDLAKEKLIITIPNSGYYTYRIRLLFGGFPVQWVHHPAEHLRFWTIRDFKHWLKSLNLANYNGDLKVVPSNGIELFWLNKLYPSLFSRQIVYVINKK